MFIANNTSLLNSFGKLTKNKTAKNELTEKISSGKRINRAADDAGGLSISESLKAQVRGLSMAEKNIQDGISMIQVADGAMDEITKTLHRMKEVSVQASNDILTDEDRQAIGEEFKGLKENINKIVKDTEFNGIKLLNENKTLNLQIRDNPYASYDLTLTDNSCIALGIDDINVSTVANSNEANGKIDEALNKITSNRTEIGSHLNNLQHSFNDVSNAGINLTASLSQVEDVNMATALMQSVKDNVILDCNKSMLASAKLNNESVNTVLNKWIS
ncbi:flagellin [Clostridium sp. MB40-C1]|uniref:flagellin n=1 Tax=Clostridium sp. MB40-C1 TaxID=3070996 RepID=UPI0027E1CB47|nr:flagellin [Clostridium sp. MB40-C1]WMJ81327.1 flagellin [Clostridium sp. MB40-C1]